MKHSFGRLNQKSSNSNCTPQSMAATPDQLTKKHNFEYSQVLSKSIAPTHGTLLNENRGNM